MKTKLTALAVAAFMTLGTFTAALPPAVAQTREEATIIINFCRTAYLKFHTGDKQYLKKKMNELPEDTRHVVALACAAYGEGYYDATRLRVLRNVA